LDAATCPDLVAEWAAAAKPGPSVGAALAGLDPVALSGYGKVDALVAAQRQVAFWQARAHRLLAALAAEPPVTGSARETYLAKQYVREQVCCALGVSAVTAAERIARAQELVHRLPQTLQALERGAISDRHTQVLTEATYGLDDATVRQVQDTVLADAAQESVASFRRSVHRAVLVADPDGQQRRQERALADRRVSLHPERDAMATLVGHLPAAGATALMTALNQHATSHSAADPRTMDQRRADALIDLVTGSPSPAHLSEDPEGVPASPADMGSHGDTASGTPPGRHRGLRPLVQVTVALSTLLGFDEQPGELAGYGAIPADLARRLAADPTGTWRRLITDDRGQLLDYGRARYRPPADLARYIAARDRTCRFPHCNRRAQSCDLDHELAWNQGGRTVASNLTALSPRHHHAKHEAGWRPERLADGSTRWTSPDGHIYRKPPATYPVDRTLTVSGDRVRRPAVVATSDPDPPPF
jgi:hypothetical protein